MGKLSISDRGTPLHEILKKHEQALTSVNKLELTSPCLGTPFVSTLYLPDRIIVISLDLHDGA